MGWIVLVVVLLCVAVVGGMLWLLRDQKPKPSGFAGFVAQPKVTPPVPRPRSAGSQIKPPPVSKAPIAGGRSTSVIAQIDPITGEKVIYTYNGKGGAVVRREPAEEYTYIDWGDGRGKVYQHQKYVEDDGLIEMGGQEDYDGS
jgi:hypothetical protein